MKQYLNKRVLRNVIREWKWIFSYIRRYKLTVFVYIFFGLFSSVLAVASSVASKFLIDAVIDKNRDTLYISASAVAVLLVSQTLFQALSSRITVALSTKVGNELRNEIYSTVVRAEWEKIGAFHSGELLNRLEGDVSTVASGIINFIPSVFSKTLTFVLSFAVVLHYDAVMAFLALLSAPFFVFSSRFLVKTIRKFSKQTREMNGKVLSFSEESLRNLQFIKSFDLVSRYIVLFKELTEKYREVRLKYEKFNILMTMVLSLLGIVVSYACYGWAVFRLWQGLITVGTMTLFLQISSTLTNSFSSLASLAPLMISISTGAGRIMEITRFKAESDADRDLAAELLKRSGDGVRIDISGLSFAYEGADANVLNGVGLSVRPGERLGLVGRSGNGKTTLLKLLLGLVRPRSGEMKLSVGDDTINISDSTRRFFSYVPQESTLFSGTVAQNLRIVAPEATDEKLMETLALACMDDFIASQPEGLEYQVGENGDNLSRGQLQRLLIARAVLRNAPVMLLDEATSALDTDTEAKVLGNIIKDDPKKIIILTAHRKSVLEYCTRVCSVTSDGRVEPFRGEQLPEEEASS
ncbi:MAG: ABC transporter ATP-binding protein/permease [Clostridia bacterium]|nr:ABC transporter ATP-binding protein/permease [Clostridia bacterium]